MHTRHRSAVQRFVLAICSPPLACLGLLSALMVSTPALAVTTCPTTVTADFSNQCMSGMVWRNSSNGEIDIWAMKGSMITSSGAIAVSPGDPWAIQGVGDFNADGKADILWRNNATGQLDVWVMDGATITPASGTLQYSPGSDWTIQGFGDFNKDGKADILWRQASTGGLAIWTMNGVTVKTTGDVASPPTDASTTCCAGVGNGWTVQAIGDYDGDGKSDILWRQTTSGQVDMWFMNGTTITKSSNVYSPPTVWQQPSLAPYGCLTTETCNILVGSNKVRASGPFDPGGHNNPAPSATTGGALLPLKWLASAASVARAYAATCPGLNHNPALNNYGFGENIYITASSNVPVPASGTDAVSSWAGEASNYTYSSNSCAPNADCGHYTQLVWRQTNGVGCAIQQCSTNSPFGASFPNYAIELCDYSPAGNINNLQPY